MIIYAKNILLPYINYVKKFEGHKPGREKRLEHDPTIFRDRISFLMLIYTFYDFLVFMFFLIMSFFKVKIPEKSSVFHCLNLFQPRRSRGYHMISYHMISYHMISYHMTSYHMIS